MIKNIKILVGLFYINSIIFLLSIFTPEVNAEIKIIAKSGDTLFKLSKQYGVPLKELMYKNNFIDASKSIEGEIVLIPSKITSKDNKAGYLTYKVVEGDTLYKISRDFKIDVKDIISINNLGNNSYLKPQQTILIPKGENYKKETMKLASKKVFYHQTSGIENLSTISEIHKISKEEINTLNKLNNPININPNIKLKLRRTKASRWLRYGSFIINWSDWTYFNGNYIAKAKTKKNTSFYLAINCKKRLLNNTLDDSYWRNWYFPKADYEFKLINDFCNEDFNF